MRHAGIVGDELTRVEIKNYKYKLNVDKDIN